MPVYWYPDRMLVINLVEEIIKAHQIMAGLYFRD